MKTSLRTRTALTLATVVVSAVALSGCAPAASVGSADVSVGGYPLTLESPYGTTVLEAKPKSVAVLSSVDLDIALALGIEPVISPQYGDMPPEPATQEKLDELGIDELATYDFTDGTDFEAIAAANPDVILATSGWTLEEDYEQLSKIAPIVSFEGKDGLATMTWDERTATAGAALGLEDEAAAVIAGVEQAFIDARAANPAFEGLSYTYAVIHPEQISYISYKGSNISFFADLGFVLPETASQFSETDGTVSKENLDLLDADVLLVGYPFGDEGLLGRDELESDQLFQSLPSVTSGHYAVIDDTIASPLAYPTPLGQLWVLERILPVLQEAVTAG